MVSYLQDSSANADLIQRDCKPEDFDKIPPHGRWQHFNAGGIFRLEPLIKEWRGAGVDEREVSRRVVDVIVVSVLLDAGAGDHWRFNENGVAFGRSEGLAIASLSAFKASVFGESCVNWQSMETSDIRTSFLFSTLGHEPTWAKR